MKKILSLLLAVALIFVSGAIITGCGDETTDTNNESVADVENVETTPTAGNSVVGDVKLADFFPEALANAAAYAIEGLEGTTWQLAGGMVDGTEMEQADLDALNSNAGGVIQFVFADATKAQMVGGENVIDGTYSLKNDDTIVHIVLPQIEYYGVVTIVAEATVLMLATPNQVGSALYFSQVTE